jgi:nicotinamide-nucleotide adenylyltransferase
MKKACFVLRAQPFHLGHLKVIKLILKKYDKVIIIIGSSQESNTDKNPFTLRERKEMIDKSLKSEGIVKERYEVIGIEDVHDDKLWVENILKKAKFDVVFSMNSWTKRCFDAFNIPVKEHPIFDDISATKVRKMIKEKKEWEGLVPEEVKKILERINLEERIKPLDI